MRNRLIFIIAGVAAIVVLAAFIALRFKKLPLDVEDYPGASGQISETALLSQLAEAEQKSDLIGMKNIYQRLINDFPSHKDVASWQKKMEEANIRIILSPLIAPGLSQEYEIQPLDNLTKIARQFKTTIELIKRSNNLASDNIRPGRRLKVWTGKFSVLVDKSQNALMLKSNDEIIKTYTVATGLNNSTPVGTFKIVTRLENPVWYKAGAIVPAESPENILGTRWLGFDLEGYGIHGTTDPSSIGRQATAGCVRMLNSEVEELYIFLPQGSEVTITD